MRESRYDLLCTILLGQGQLCMFTGYDTQLLIVKPVLHSVNNRSNLSIDANAGYYGSAVVSLVTNVGNLAAPWALGILGSKNSLIIGSLLFSLHMSTFFFIHSIPFYTTSALLGFGFALYYTGQSGYLTEHSTTLTIGRNSALNWALSTSCMIFGGILLLITTKAPDFDDSTNDGRTNVTDIYSSERNFSASEIRLIYGALLIVTIFSNIIFAWLPTRPVKHSIATVSNKKHRVGFVNHMKEIAMTMKDPCMLQLIPLFGYIGLAGSILGIVYPTALSYTKKLASNIYLPAYYSIAFGLSNMITGFTIGIVSSLMRNVNTFFLLIIGVTINSFAMLLILLSTPTKATFTHTSDDALIEPNPTLPLFIAVLFGIGDNCVNTSRSVICSTALQDKQPQVFAISKFHQTLLQAILMFLSPELPVNAYFVAMVIYGIVAVVLYQRVIAQVTHKDELVVESDEQVSETST